MSGYYETKLDDLCTSKKWEKACYYPKCWANGTFIFEVKAAKRFFLGERCLTEEGAREDAAKKAYDYVSAL